MDTATVARFYNVDPDIVDYEWSYIDFLDRREYMFVHEEIKERFTPEGTD